MSVEVVLDEEHVVVVAGRLVGGLHDGVVVAQEIRDLRGNSDNSFYVASQSQFLT